jgi:hypothetical protein
MENRIERDCLIAPGRRSAPLPACGKFSLTRLLRVC